MNDKFEFLKDYKTWILKFSGGIDSTLILYYMSKIREDQELWLVTGVNNNETIYNGHASDIVKALDVFQLFKYFLCQNCQNEQILAFFIAKNI